MSFRGALASGRVLTLDGGTGSELRRRGLALSDVCWSASVNLDHGALLEAIHRDYIAAGADIVTANTFGTTRFVLDAAGLGGSFEEVNRSALRAARAATDALTRPLFVAASLSCMPPRFDRSAWPPAAAEYDAYRELADLFAEAGVDVVLLEMLQSAPHAERACRAVRATGLPFVAGLSCRLGGAATHAEAGSARRQRVAQEPAETAPAAPTLVAPTLVAFDDPSLPFEPVLDSVLDFAPDAVAIMHTPLDAMLPALDLLRSRWQGPVGAWAEIPYPEDPEGGGSERVSPGVYAAAARGWIGKGARILGGCCGTTPTHIAALTASIAP